MTDAEAMNSVPEKKLRRGSILTKDVMAGIPVLVQQGWTAEAIAARIGCTVGTLRVRCSMLASACAYPKRSRWCRWCRWCQLSEAPHSRTAKAKAVIAFAVPTTLQLSKVAMSRLRQRAEAIGMTEAELVTNLLEVIAQDDLYDAVLDTAKAAA